MLKAIPAHLYVEATGLQFQLASIIHRTIEHLINSGTDRIILARNDKAQDRTRRGNEQLTLCVRTARKIPES